MSHFVRLGVFDSGVGGLSLMKEFVVRRWNVQITYIADSAGFPYSTKTQAEIQARAQVVMAEFQRQNCTAIVVACNTASLYALAYLRENFPDHVFFGTVPAVKPALASTPDEKILLLVTESSARNTLLHQQIAEQDPNRRIEILGTTTLVEAIENQDFAAVEREIQGIAAQTSSQYRHVILGCTHFPLALKWFQEIFPKETIFYTPEIGVANRVQSVLQLGLSMSEPKCTVLSTDAQAQEHIQQWWQVLTAHEDNAKRSIATRASDILPVGEEGR